MAASFSRARLLPVVLLVGSVTFARAEDKLPTVINGPGAQAAMPDQAQAAYERGRREQAEQDRKSAADRPDAPVPSVIYGVPGLVIGVPRDTVGPGGLNNEGINRGLSQSGHNATGLNREGFDTGGVSTRGLGLGRVTSDGLSPRAAVPRNPRGPEAGLGLKGF